MPIARPLLVASLMGLLATTASVANAQQVFRNVGPDGRVTFSDKPPADAAAASPRPGAPAGASAIGALPFELREVARKYPVTLFSAPNCGPCGAGRAFLSSRGIPFAEKTVSTGEDVEALQRLAGEASLPLLTIGAQQIKGYSDGEWGQFLDAAGYPKSSVLPASYRNAAAVPLVTVQRAVSAEAESPQGQAGPATSNRRPVTRQDGTSGSAAAAPDTGNPAGIRF